MPRDAGASSAPHSASPPSSTPHSPSHPTSSTPQSPSPPSSTPHSASPPSSTPHSASPPSSTLRRPLPAITRTAQPLPAIIHAAQPLPAIIQLSCDGASRTVCGGHGGSARSEWVAVGRGLDRDLQAVRTRGVTMGGSTWVQRGAVGCSNPVSSQRLSPVPLTPQRSLLATHWPHTAHTSSHLLEPPLQR